MGNKQEEQVIPLDIFTNILTAFNLSKLLIVENDDLYSFSIFFGLILGFYMMTYEDYKLGEMYFPMINGTDEGNLFIFILGVCCGIFGQDFLFHPIISKYSITLDKIIEIGIVLGGFSCMFNLYLHTYKKKGFKELMIIFLDNVPFYSVLIIPIYYIIFKTDFYINYKWLIIANSCLIFARITLDIQIKILTMDTIGCNYMVFFSNIIYIFSVTIPSKILKYYTLLVLLFLQIIELCAFIIIRTRELTNYLNIRLFCVNNTANVISSSI